MPKSNTQENEGDRYQLSAATLAKIGLNQDYSEKAETIEGDNEENESTDPNLETDELIKEYGEGEVGINIGTEFLRGKDKPESKETEEGEGKETKSESDEALSKELSSNQTDKTDNKDDESSEALSKELSSSEDSKEYDGVLAIIKERFPEKEQLAQFEKDLKNHADFQATNTKKSQEVSAIMSRLGTEKAEKVITGVLNMDETDRKDFLVSSDNWYSDQDSNPIREVIEFIMDHGGNIKEHKKELSDLDEERLNLSVEKEIFAVQKLDDRYNDVNELQALAKHANENGFDLMQSHKVLAAERMQAENEGVLNQLKDIKKDKAKLSAELKKRVAEIEQLKATIQTDDTGLMGGDGLSTAVDTEQADYGDDFDAVQRSVEKKLNVMHDY